jgi:polygalacturonase
MTNLPR